MTPFDVSAGRKQVRFRFPIIRFSSDVKALYDKEFARAAGLRYWRR